MEFTIEASTLFLLFAVIAGMILILFVGWLGTSAKPRLGIEPYTKTPLRPFTNLRYPTVAKIQAYLEQGERFENRMFNVFKACYCRETGRIYPNTVGFFGNIHVDWSFITKKYPGHYVSWGSLGEDLQREIREAHDSLEGFQTERSSPNPLPKDVLPEYYLLKPGPLYVNIETKDLLGWKCVPDTDMEVFILQKPKNGSMTES